jgi:rod shape-determining protein MreC
MAMPELAKNRKYVLLALATVLLTVLMSLAAQQDVQVRLVEGVFRDALAPVQRVIITGSEKITQAISFVSEVRSLGAENARLRRELEELKDRENVTREIWNENVRLRQLVGLPSAYPEYELMGARVVARDPGNWYKTIVIDRGSQSGVQENAVVLAAGGVAGRVVQVSAHTAEVLLISDQRSAVGAMGQLSRDMGVLQGGDGGGGQARLVYLPRTATIRPGEAVVTSGMGGVFPKGLLLGRVTEVTDEDYGLAKHAIVEPLVDLDHVEEVLVIVGTKN